MATQRQYEPTATGAGNTGALGRAANDASRAGSLDDDDLPLADTVVQLPLVQQFYRAVKSWQEEFAPRDYGQLAIPAEQPRPHGRN